MPASSSRPGGPVTPSGIVDAALCLTAERGLESWTLRQLARAVDAYPAVIYHHVGDREAVVRAVCERVLAQLPLPDTGQKWNAWFSELFTAMRPLLRRYPGTARRVALFGKTLPGACVYVDTGIEMLRGAGFGEESVLAFNSMLCTACQLVSMEDDRVVPQDYDGQLYGYAMSRCVDGLAHRLGEMLCR